MVIDSTEMLSLLDHELQTLKGAIQCFESHMNRQAKSLIETAMIFMDAMPNSDQKTLTLCEFADAAPEVFERAMRSYTQKLMQRVLLKAPDLPKCKIQLAYIKQEFRDVYLAASKSVPQHES